ncbi:TonB-linked SusC/RagA family outer membrane protein [Chitinophaga niastensis]|uniref:TonB-linked SusC/RagA family outer membrane protein n=1 Tax=Chitinophaga niastensis TaxID=536980 RepID=A0A2P8HJ01_CHINA|nr:SusC/RagA family TonB-linked outer membrane protein [Chitinophaga niastensis]PSL46198.1 TonB-linked SusC/RagA family outer membrane protein [Chitinophaga niastensis]
MQKSLTLTFIPGIMRWSVMVTVFILGSFTLLYANNGYSQLLQRVRVTEKFENESLASCVKKLESGYRISFGYDNQELLRYQVKKLQFVNERLDKVLQALLENTPLIYEEKNGVLLIVKQAPLPLTNLQQPGPGKIKGIVIDGEHGIPGVTVKVTGTKYYAITNADGQFELILPAGNYKLQFSFIGYKAAASPEVKVISGAITEQNMSMFVTMSRLTEAVVIGYGVQERRSLLGAVATYEAGKAPGQSPVTIDEAMVGKLPGVFIAPSSGVPGSAANITIRGISTLNANGNSPLIVVDGVPIYGIDPNLNTVDYNKGSSSIFSFGGNQVVNEYRQPTTFEKNPLATLNPDDIESVEVLKDAYSTAIYGSRGSAGVILITTKKGARGKMRVDVQVSTSVSKPRKLPSLMNGDQYADFYNNVFHQKDSIGKAASSWYIPNNYTFPKGVNTNWLNEVVRNAMGNNAEVSMSGGTDKTNYYVSLGYNKEQSYIINNDFTRYQGRVNFDNQMTNSLKVGVSMSLNQATNNSLSAQNVYRSAVQKAPNLSVKDSTGNKYNWLHGNNPTGPEEVSNPVGEATTGKNYSTDNRVLGNVFAELQLLPWLSAHSDVGVDWINSRAYDRIIDRPGVIGGSATETQQQLRKWVINNRLDMHKIFGDGHAVSAMLGQSFEKSVENVNSVHGTEFLNDDMLSIATANDKRVVNSLEQQWAQVSFLSRINYEYKHRYLAGVTYRMDGSSRFSANHRYVGFPSFALGWVPSEENFLKGVKAIDQLKVRASVGFTGNDGGNGYYGNQGQYVVDVYGSSYGNTSTIGNKQPANPNLEWERTTTWNVGTDISLLHGRISATVDYYRRQTSNAILQSALPYFMGFDLQQQNRADLVNKGIEFSISSENIHTENFQWNTTFNISGNRNIVVRLHQIDEEQLAAENEISGGRFWRVGHSATAFYLYDWAGVNSSNGQPQWVDKSGKTSEVPIQKQYPDSPYTNRKYMGDAMPVVFGGFGNTFTYKGFELNCFFSFSAGNKMYNGAKAAMYSYLGSSYGANNVYNLSSDMVNYWQHPGQKTDIPALINNSNFSQAGFGSSYDYTLDRRNNRFLEDASFIKLRSLLLGYNFNSRQLKGTKVFTALKLYAEANNLFILTKYSGLDPEVSAYGSSALNMGYDELTMPSPRTWRVGIKASF